MGPTARAAVVVMGFLLAAIVGMTSAASPWVAGDGSRASPPRIVGEVLAVALAVGLCILLALIWIHTPQTRQGEEEIRLRLRSTPTRWDRACGRARSS